MSLKASVIIKESWATWWLSNVNYLVALFASESEAFASIGLNIYGEQSGFQDVAQQAKGND